MTKENNYHAAQLLIVALSAVVAIGGVAFKLVLDRMDKQERVAASDIAALREEIKMTKIDAKDAVAAAAIASKDAVAATAIALKESVAATAVASKDSMNASASALRDAVTSTGVSAKEAVAATAANLSEKIEILRNRMEKLEDKITKTHQP